MQMFDLPLRGFVKELQVPSNVRNFWSPEQSGLGLQTSLKKFSNTKIVCSFSPRLLLFWQIFNFSEDAPPPLGCDLSLLRSSWMLKHPASENRIL